VTTNVAASAIIPINGIVDRKERYIWNCEKTLKFPIKYTDHSRKNTNTMLTWTLLRDKASLRLERL
jgi:hypothetical protein